MQLSGTFHIVDWQESTQQTFEEGAKLNAANVKQSYNGDIQGTSEIHYLMSYSKDGNANFIGFEYISATIDAQSCSLVLKHDGRFENGVASSQFVVLSAEGIDGLTGKTGHFAATDGGQVQYQIG